MQNGALDSRPSKIQWTLRDLFVGTVFASAFCAAFAFFGSGPAFLGFLFFSSLLTISFGLRVFYKGVCVAICLFFAIFVFGSEPLILNCVLHVAFLSWHRNGKPFPPLKIALTASLSFSLISITYVLQTKMDDYAQLREARRELPVQQLGPRLRYENKLSNRNSANGSPVHYRLSDHWKDFELTLLTDLGAWPQARNLYLRQVHDKHVENFLKSAGFGVGRMEVFHTPKSGVLPELENIPFRYADNQRPKSFDEGTYWITPQWKPNDQPIDFHFAGLVDFFNTTTFGLKVSSKKTIGFEPHAFHFSAEPVMYQADRYLLKRLQLISVRRFDEPRVYVLNHLPRMDQLLAEDVALRTPNTFELQSLTNIEKLNEDVVTDIIDDRLLMVGSIRAVQSCLDCHAANHGELLGAFTYQFEPINRQPQESQR